MNVEFIVIHCSATRYTMPVTIADIDRWHKAQGWKSCGYHFVILRDGTVQKGRLLGAAGAHVAGHNYHSIGICYVGGLDLNDLPADTRTKQQRDALAALVSELLQLFPAAKVVGHHDLNPHKACPCFDVSREFS